MGCQKEFGVWETLTEVLKNLDEENPTWKENKQASVKLPLTNSTDQIGLKKLRHEVADYVYPTVSKDKSLDLELNLRISTQTEEGKRFFEEYKNFYEHGGNLTIPPEFITELSPSEWHRKLYGGSVKKLV